MKRFLALLSSITIFAVFLLPINAFAASATASMSGTGTVRAGDTITVTFYVNNPSDVYGGQGTLSYNSSQLTYSKATSNLSSDWDFGYNNGSFTFMDNPSDPAQYAPLSGGHAIFTATFTVNSGLAVGTSISVSATNLKVSDGNSDFSVGSASYSATIAAPVTTTTAAATTKSSATTKAGTTVANLPSNAFLSSLSASNATLSPSFNKTTTKYTTTVDYSISKLNLSGTTEDAKATLTVTGNNSLAVGTNTVSITVKAQNGATKVYTITVTKKDANGNIPTTVATTVATTAANANNSLSGITATGFAISPAFSPNVKSYVVYLPYETTSIALAGTPADSNATVKVVGGTNLSVGDNTVKVICTAANGKSTTYTICAVRAPKWGTVTTAKASTVSSDKEKESGAPIWLVILLCVVSAVLGFIISLIIYKKKINSLYDYDDDDSDDDNNSGNTYNDINYNRNSQNNSNQNNHNSYNTTINTPIPPAGLNTNTTHNTTNPPVRPNTSNTPSTTNTVNNPGATNSTSTPSTSSFENNAFYKQNSNASNDNNTQKQEKKGKFIKNPFEQSADD